MENTENGYKGMNMYILADSPAAINALNDSQMNSKLLWRWTPNYSGIVISRWWNWLNIRGFKLTYVLGHTGIERNETADQLARQRSSKPLIWTEPAFGISAKVASVGWSGTEEKKTWGALAGHMWTDEG
jgi:ribonuclease HI